MAKAQKKLPLAYSIILIVLAILVLVIVYKQVFLGSRITNQLPKAALTTAIESCLQENLRPSLLQGLAEKNSLVKNSFMDVKTLLNDILQGISASMVNMEIKQNYITELKVEEITDFLGNHAQVRVKGVVEVESSAPTLGNMLAKKHYLTEVYKRDSDFYFEHLSVKEPEQANWQKWACARTLTTATNH